MSSSSSSTLVRPTPPATAPDAKPTETEPPSSSQIIKEGLHKRWQTVMQEIGGGDAVVSRKWWTEIVTEYGGKEERRWVNQWLV